MAELPRNTRNMPVFRDCAYTYRTAENGLLGSKGGHRPGFSRATCAVRFQGGHKANAMRSEAPRFGDSELTFASTLDRVWHSRSPFLGKCTTTVRPWHHVLKLPRRPTIWVSSLHSIIPSATDKTLL